MDVNEVLSIHEAYKGLVLKLVGDVTPEQMVKQFPPFVNHPTWQLGHIAFTYDRVAGILGDKPELPEDWKVLYGGGSQPVEDLSKYPSKEAIVGTFTRTHGRLPALLRAADPSVFAKENPLQFLRGQVPTLGGGLTFMLVAHTFLHAGQLMSWRKLAGLPGVL